ncbi:MAG: hypothetical protein Q8K18_04215 [Burkholderiales bacterium]|nr:hypothetical protein [Burkholderiales bacterium]
MYKAGIAIGSLLLASCTVSPVAEPSGKEAAVVCNSIRFQIEEAQKEPKISAEDVLAAFFGNPSSARSSSETTTVPKEEQLGNLLEVAQINGCEGITESYAWRVMSPKPVINIAGRPMTCTKRNGVVVYVAFGKWPGLYTTWVGSVAPKGPAIWLKEDIKAYPAPVQYFLYERACQAHLTRPMKQIVYQGWQTQSYHEEECAAVKVLAMKGLLDERGVQQIVEYGRRHEHYERWRPRKDIAIQDCYANSSRTPN